MFLRTIIFLEGLTLTGFLFDCFEPTTADLDLI